ncbi:hypothetical protein [Sorangium sp. So ce1389]|uniref:hypothetical protein n=1 Tax=Sorangium sp. So ce1389 TaxID=3133336 RepID=UPI003F61CD05
MPEEISRRSCRSSGSTGGGAGRAARRGLGRAALGLVLALAASAPAMTAWAEPTIAERARADALRREAQQLLAAGRPEAACPKLEESDRLSPSAATKLELARCREGTGRLASAWALYSEVGAAGEASVDAKQGAEARERAAALEQRLPRLAIVLSGEVKALPGLEVRLDGVEARGVGEARPVEPGKHKVTATAPGREAFMREVEVSQPRQLAEVHVTALEPTAAALDPAPAAVDAAWRRPDPPGVRPDPIHRKLMWVTGGLTLAGIALGSTFGGLALSTWSKVDDAARTACSDPARYRDCAQPVPNLSRRAASYATVSDFCFIAAGAALAGTAVLWWTLPPDGPRAGARVQIVPGVLGGAVVGVF